MYAGELQGVVSYRLGTGIMCLPFPFLSLVLLKLPWVALYLVLRISQHGEASHAPPYPPSRDMWANSPHVQASRWHPCPPDEGGGNSQCGCHLPESPMRSCTPDLGTQLGSFVGAAGTTSGVAPSGTWMSQMTSQETSLTSVTTSKPGWNQTSHLSLMVFCTKA